MAKFWELNCSTPGFKSYMFYCPGCEQHHSVFTEVPQGRSEPCWQFNGDVDKPTISPSILVWGSKPEKRCHSFVKDGNIQFLNDCYHKLKGQTVPIPEDD